MRTTAPQGFYGRGTVTGVIGSINDKAPQIYVTHDGQTGQALAFAQYTTTPAVGDRVLILTVGTTMYATGYLR